MKTKQQKHVIKAVTQYTFDAEVTRLRELLALVGHEIVDIKFSFIGWNTLSHKAVIRSEKIGPRRQYDIEKSISND